MAARVSETFVLRTYPYKEADLIVSFFTRDEGKLRGIARRARKPKSAFGAGLERMSRVRMAYYQRENAELANLTSCEMISSPFDLGPDYGRSLALDFITEATEHMLPAHEPNEKFFRLMIAVVAYLKEGGSVWAAILYFSLWAVRLSGVFPEIRVRDESAAIAHEMLEMPLTGLAEREWTKATASDLRRALVRTMEQHVERKFLTVPLLEAL